MFQSNLLWLILFGNWFAYSGLSLNFCRSYINIWINEWSIVSANMGLISCGIACLKKTLLECHWHLFIFHVNWRWIILQELLLVWEINLMDVESVKHWIPYKELQNARGCSFWLEWTSIRWETSCEAPSSEPQSHNVSQFEVWRLLVHVYADAMDNHVCGGSFLHLFDTFCCRGHTLVRLMIVIPAIEERTT